MRKLLLIALFICANQVLAAPVFKCKGPGGKIIYQNKECLKGGTLKEVKIKKFDKSIIEKAQKKLQKDLEEQAKQDEEQAKKDKRNRELESIEDNTRAGETLRRAQETEADLLREISGKYGTPAY